MPGYVYVITNETMPGLVKVGMTHRSAANRAEELRSTGTAGPFVVSYELAVDDPAAVESDAHEILRGRHEDKEWFRCSVDVAVSAIHQASGSLGDSTLTMVGFVRRSPGPMTLLSEQERQHWNDYYQRERAALSKIGIGHDEAERQAWYEYARQEIRSADIERAYAIRGLRN